MTIDWRVGAYSSQVGMLVGVTAAILPKIRLRRRNKGIVYVHAKTIAPPTRRWR